MEKLKNPLDILNMFLDYHRYTDLTKHIHLVENETYVATDAHQMIMIDEDAEIEKYNGITKNALEHVSNIETNSNIIISVGKVKTILSAIPIVNEKCECYECEGEEGVNCYYEASNGYTYSIPVICPICNGDGTIFSGNLTSDYDSYIFSFGMDIFIKSRYAANIIKVCELIGVDEFRITGLNPDKKTLEITIIDGVKIVVAGYIADEDTDKIKLIYE